MAIILDGKKTAEQIRAEVKESVDLFYFVAGCQPCLAVVQVGDNEASSRYIRNKQRACEQVGILSRVELFKETVELEELCRVIDSLNNDETVHGILVQLPLPQRLSSFTDEILARIDPNKDVDGFHDFNAGKVLKFEDDGLQPCTPYGIMTLLQKYDVPLEGKHCVIVGRSNIVGKPLSMMMLRRDATVTICHSKTPDLGFYTRQADILVSAVGKPNFITPDMVKPGAAVVDVGINVVDGKMCGDVNKQVEQTASYFTPVPGGVGPMTVAMLLLNTVKAAAQQLNLNV